MAIIVKKFGGTSVADLERIKNVAKLVMKERANGYQVVVVVSAMATVTNSLVDLAKKASSLDDNEKLAEYDSILSTGEQISSALLALILQSYQVKARSWLGWQIPTITDNTHSKANILEINTDKIQEALNLDIKKTCRSLNPARTISQRENMLKLANEVERFNQVSIWI